MIVHDSWWSNGSARSTIIDYHEPFDQGFTLPSCSLNYRVHPEFTLDIVHSLNTWTKRNAPSGFTLEPRLASRPPRYYSHFLLAWPKAQSVIWLLMRPHRQYGQIFVAFSDRTNGVPLCMLTVNIAMHYLGSSVCTQDQSATRKIQHNCLISFL